MPWNNTGKTGKKWQTNSSIQHILHWLQSRQQRKSERKTMGNNAHVRGWQSCTQEGKEICSSAFLSPCLCHQASKTPWLVGAVVCEYKTDCFSYLLTTTLLQRLFVATRRCHYRCPSCHLHHLPPERITFFINHKTPSGAHSFNNCFFFKRHLDTDVLHSPFLPQCLHLELQSEQQGQKALQEEHSRERKQIKDILCAFKASPIKFCRFVTTTARDTSHRRETLPISCSVKGSASKADSCTCLPVSPLQTDVAVQWITFRIPLY